MGERIDHIATGKNLSPEEELLPHHGGRKQRRWRWIRGHFPVPAGCRHRNSGPPKLGGDGGGDRNCFWRKGFWNQGFRDGRINRRPSRAQEEVGAPQAASRRGQGWGRAIRAPGAPLAPLWPHFWRMEASGALIFYIFFPEFFWQFK